MRKFGVIVVFVFITSFWLFNPFSNNRFAKIPTEERQTLERFVWKLFCMDHFAYVLFGEKAIAISMYAEKEPIFDQQLSFKEAQSQSLHRLITDPTMLLMNSCFEITNYEIRVWKKYKHLFSSNNFLFIESDIGNNIKELLFINKKKLFDVLQKNHNTFKRILGDSFTTEKLYHEICEGRHDILKTLHEHEGLFGILLGFGKKILFCTINVINFCEKLAIFLNHLFKEKNFM